MKYNNIVPSTHVENRVRGLTSFIRPGGKRVLNVSLTINIRLYTIVHL